MTEIPDFPLGDELSAAVELDQSRWDDGFWARHVRLPFTWQRYINWWAARRYVMPRDPKKW